MRPRVADILAQVVAGDARESPTARLCRQATTALRVSGAGVALMSSAAEHGGLVAASDGPAETLEELQFTLGEGPCVDASRSGRPALHSDLDASVVTRWPAFGAAAVAAGVGAIFAFPLQVGGIRLGVLDLYRETPGRLSDRELADALAFADAATQLLLHLSHAGADGDHSALAEAYDNRAVVHQATGMISVQLGVDLAVALVRLRAHAYAEQRPVGDIAADVVDRLVRFADTTSGTSHDDL